MSSRDAEKRRKEGAKKRKSVEYFKKKRLGEGLKRRESDWKMTEGTGS